MDDAFAEKQLRASEQQLETLEVSANAAYDTEAIDARQIANMVQQTTLMLSKAQDYESQIYTYAQRAKGTVRDLARALLKRTAAVIKTIEKRSQKLETLRKNAAKKRRKEAEERRKMEKKRREEEAKRAQAEAEKEARLTASVIMPAEDVRVDLSAYNDAVTDLQQRWEDMEWEAMSGHEQLRMLMGMRRELDDIMTEKGKAIAGHGRAMRVALQGPNMRGHISVEQRSYGNQGLMSDAIWKQLMREVQDLLASAPPDSTYTMSITDPSAGVGAGAGAGAGAGSGSGSDLPMAAASASTSKKRGREDEDRFLPDATLPGSSGADLMARPQKRPGFETVAGGRSSRKSRRSRRSRKSSRSRRSRGSRTVFGKLRRGDLIKYGYEYRLADRLRHGALEKAIKHYGALSVYHKLDAVAKLTKHTAPDASAIFSKDREWVRARLSSSRKSRRSRASRRSRRSRVTWRL